VKRMLLSVMVALVGAVGVVAGQEGAAGGGPTTYALARKANYIPLETLRETRLRIPAPLARRVSVQRDSVLLQQVLLDVANQAELGLSYGEDLVRAHVVVSLHMKNGTAADALQEIVEGTDWAVLVTPAGQVAVVRAEPPQVGTIVGRVTDAKTQTALAGATVVLEGTRRSATTETDGRYRLADVAPGTYTVRARYIGYAPGTAAVTVSADHEATADFTLEKSAQKLEEVVTTGTVVPTEVKALPTPVSIITDQDFALQRPHTVQELIRQQVPTAVAWDTPAYPAQTTFSVRGSSSIGSGGQGQIKVFLDGIPMSDFSFASVDPNSVGRVEVIRGPQAAAIYGSDALGGVMQIFTKRGDSTSTRPEWTGEAALGLVQTPYADYEHVVRQSYRGSVLGGGPGVSYAFGAGYTHTPDWAQPASAQSSTSAYGSVHATRGVLTADVSGRYWVQNNPQVFEPDLAATGFVSFLKPNYQPAQYRAQTLAGKLTLALTSWWHHTVVAGVDRINSDGSQTQPRLTTPADTFFTAYNQDETKTFVAYNSSIQGGLGESATGSLAVGFDHYSVPTAFWGTGSAPSTSTSTGAIGLATVTRSLTTNTGYFTQGQLAFHDALFLTAGVRAEQNSNFGDALGTPVSPQFGLTYARDVGATTLKLRGSWGRAIRPPTPAARFGSGSLCCILLPNPQIALEHQQGWDAGVDAIFGTRGSVSVTAFHQTGTDLIAQPLVAAAPLPTYQYLNVGRVKNTGIELEGMVAVGVFNVHGQYGYVRSRVQEAGAAGGDLLPGDQLLAIPTHTAGVSVSVAPHSGTSLTAGATYVGEFLGYDIAALYRCFGGTGPCRSGPGLRSYITTLPSLFKVNATGTQQLTPALSGFVSIDNLTNNTDHEFTQAIPVIGRITTVGLRLQH
jgi:outer membrane receptor protein involved in Fe transport